MNSGACSRWPLLVVLPPALGLLTPWRCERVSPGLRGALLLLAFFPGSSWSSCSIPQLQRTWALPGPTLPVLKPANSLQARVRLTSLSPISGMAVPCCPLSYVLNTIVSYILSGILVLPCRRIKMVLTLYQLEKNHLCILGESNASLFSSHLLKCRNVSLCSKWPQDTEIFKKKCLLLSSLFLP